MSSCHFPLSTQNHRTRVLVSCPCNPNPRVYRSRCRFVLQDSLCARSRLDALAHVRHVRAPEHKGFAGCLHIALRKVGRASLDSRNSRRVVVVLEVFKHRLVSMEAQCVSCQLYSCCGVITRMQFFLYPAEQTRVCQRQ